ncbi:Succinate-acetate/proton symporter SatP [Klebsiella pneumoniae]|nr:Succinate-acetate/proton symporter SatP [Klebsiella pneumoniae]CAH5205782.1 Succinate-acetate/proton symporter SatP [Klebsiella pneumoniae]
MGNTKLANPAPLGLMGFGMTTILLNLANSGLFAFDVAILAMGIFYGGIAQIFAGLLEYKKGNTFGLTAFTSYGSFWLTLVAILLMPKMAWQTRQTRTSSVCTSACGASLPCLCSLAP